ncbi:SMP-30/gluconolactonase/LRE family protein [Opitutales bacterium]|jgi:gluconolactonase|nr:SMP-30/gluconolactonase/LRE family protein [Opitutales bacterium]
MIRILLLFLILLPISINAQDLVFAEDSEWEVISDGHQFAEGMAWDKEGHFYFTDVPRNLLYKVDKDTGEKTLIDGATGRANGIAFGPDGRLYGCSSGDKAINAWDPKTWEKTAINTGTQSNDIAILNDGTIFYTDPNSKLVWRLAAGSFERNLAATLPWKPNGIALSLDQKTLLVAEFDSDTVHGFSIGENSRLTGTSFPAYKLGMTSESLTRLDGMVVLADGRLLSGTALGTQIVPPVHASAASGPIIIIPSPDGRPRCNYARISPDNQWMYTAYRDDLLRRRLVEGFGQP